MMAPEDIEAEYSAFLDGQREDYLLRRAAEDAEFQDYCDGRRDAFLDELEAGE